MKPLDILNEWAQAVNKVDVNELIALYDESAILIPTFSNRILNTPEKIRDYFERLGDREELSISLHENTLNVQSLNDQFYALSGIYTWRFKVDGELLNFEAHFSYIIDVARPNPIIHHHSSQIPRML